MIEPNNASPLNLEAANAWNKPDSEYFLIHFSVAFELNGIVCSF